MQAVAATVTQHSFPSVAKKQVLGQSLPEVEGCLALPGVLGLVEYGFDLLASLAPGIGDVFQSHLQGLEAVLGACIVKGRRESRAGIEASSFLHAPPANSHPRQPIGRRGTGGRPWDTL